MAENSLESIPEYLKLSLDPRNAKQAEVYLKLIELQPGFAINLLHVIALTNLDASVRLAGALFFKNLVRRKWMNEDGVYLLPVDDINKIKQEILDIMVQLSPQLQVQIGELIALIAESDFPHNWQNLIDSLVSKLSLEDCFRNRAILSVCHSIFKKWRPLFRSDELFLEIKMVLDKFAQPFLQMFVELDKLIDVNGQNASLLNIYLENMLLMVQIYYDLNCQDIPEFFEDNMTTLMNIVHKYLNFNLPLITKPDEDEEVDILIKVKTSIIELIMLYITRYSDIFDPLIQTFISSVWSVINDYASKQSKYDLLVVKCLQFYCSIIKLAKFLNIFDSETSLNEIIEKVILPNIYFREIDEEHFEDEPISYIRADLEGSDFDSRRKSATDFLKELKEINPELLTNSVMKYVNLFLSGLQDWRNKDTAIYLFSSLATKGSVTNIGVTLTNVHVDVVKFFSDYIANDLINSSNSSNPILVVDSIKYILVFRNQLTKDQLLTTIPLLITHLKSSNPAIYTYAAITIDRLLEMTDFTSSNEPVFNKMDIELYTIDLLSSLFEHILQNSSTPEKLAENEFLMKCIMRVLNTSADSLKERLPIIEQLVKILQITSKNPSNPKFSHYTFESISLLIKFDLENINQYIQLVIPALLNILGEDVQEFVPYTFQILAYLLESYPKLQGLPDTYKSLIKPILSPSVWEFRGNIPGITRLLTAIILQDGTVFSGLAETITPLLGVFQKLISSKVNDAYGFDLLTSIFLHINLEALQPYLNQIAILLLTRLKNSRTAKFAKRFVLFLLTLVILPDVNVDAGFINAWFDGVQTGVFQQVFTSIVLPTTETIANLQEKKVITLALVLFASVQLLAAPTIEQLVKNLQSYSGINASTSTTGPVGVVAPAPADEFETSAAFGSQFSKIASIQTQPYDPLPNVKNSDFQGIKYLAVNELKKLPIMSQLSPEVQQQLSQL